MRIIIKTGSKGGKVRTKRNTINALIANFMGLHRVGMVVNYLYIVSYQSHGIGAAGASTDDEVTIHLDYCELFTDHGLEAISEDYIPYLHPNLSL
ncbi:MAG: hypothetical protein ACEQSC_01320 [Candidatus Nanopelagicaceae bacterium]